MYLNFVYSLGECYPKCRNNRICVEFLLLAWCECPNGLTGSDCEIRTVIFPNNNTKKM